MANYLAGKLVHNIGPRKDRSQDVPNLPGPLGDCQRAVQLIGDGLECAHPYLLGSGSFGVVYRVERPSDKANFALKVQKLRGRTQGQRDEEVRLFFREVEAMAASESKHVVTVERALATPTCALVLMEYAQGGTLVEFFNRNKAKFGVDNQDRAMLALLMIARGVEAVHKAGFVHRDLKMENLVIKDGQIKVIDLGLSVEAGLESSGVAGTFYTMDPLSLVGKPFKWTPASDVYALGVMLFQMATLKEPFCPRQDRIRGEWLVEPKVALRDRVYCLPEGIDAEVAGLISEMLVLDLAKRIQVKDLIARANLYLDARERRKRPIAPRQAFCIDNRETFKVEPLVPKKRICSSRVARAKPRIDRLSLAYLLGREERVFI